MVERKNRVRVFVVSASEQHRCKLLELCREAPAVDVVGMASDIHDLCPSVLAQEPDIFLIKLDLHQQEERDVIDNIMQHIPRSKIVLLSNDATMNSTECNATRALQFANAGFHVCIDSDDADRLRAAIMALSAPMDESQRPQEAHDGKEYLYGYIDPASNRQSDKPHGVVRQMAERRQKQAGRRQAEIQRMEVTARFQSLIEQLPGLPYIARLDKNGSMIYVSPKIEELLGFTPEQWCNDPELRIRQLHPEDRVKLLQAITAAVEDNGEYSVDYRIFGCNGKLHWLHDEARVMTDDTGHPLFLQGAALDITERKQAQLELERSHAELQELIGALDALRGEEQRRLAQEMHDDFGQLLTAMKMDLSTLRQCLPQDNSQVVKHLSSINELVDAMVTSVRRIIADLPPKILEDLGLYTALESMARNFERRHRIACHLHISDSEPALDVRIAIAVYRLIQEALNNVANHAHASCAEVHIECDSSSMAVRVSDNGDGMALDSLQKRGSFGLIGMRERTTALGGKMSIESTERQGTTIQIQIPLRAPAVPRL